MSKYEIDDVFRDLGKLVCLWANLEFSFASLFGGLLGEPHKEKISIFYSVPSNHARSELLRKAVLNFKMTEEQKETCLGLIKKFNRLNSVRNKYIHAMYGFKGCPNSTTEVFTADFTKPYYHESGFFNVATFSDLNKSEISNHLKAVQALTVKTHDFSESVLKTNFINPELPIIDII